MTSRDPNKFYILYFLHIEAEFHIAELNLGSTEFAEVEWDGDSWLLTFVADPYVTNPRRQVSLDYFLDTVEAARARLVELDGLE